MNQDPPIHWVLILSCGNLFDYISIKIVTMDYFQIVKVAVASQVKGSISLAHEITVNTNCDITMGRSCCLGNHVMSLDDVAIDTRQSCDQQLGSYTQDPLKPGSFTQDRGGKKKQIFYFKNLI